jgi:hypothetical protein
MPKAQCAAHDLLSKDPGSSLRSGRDDVFRAYKVAPIPDGVADPGSLAPR